MKTIVIGIVTCFSVDNHEYFPDSVVLNIHGEDVRVVIHRNVVVSVTDNAVTKNCDVVIDYTYGKENAQLKRLMGDNYIWQGRTHKSEQLTLLLMAGIQGLPVFTTTQHEGFNLRKNIARLGLPTGVNKRYVVKPESGAAGEDQFIVKGNQLIAFMDVIHDKTVSEVLEQFPEVIHSEEQQATSTDEVKEITLDNSEAPATRQIHNRFVITEFVEDIKREYRVILAGGEAFFYERTRSGDTYVHANLNRNKPVIKEDSLVLERLDIPKHAELRRYVCEIGKATGMLLGSIDVFEREDGTLGVFEFSSQFGTYNICPSQIHKLYHSFVEYITRRFIGPDLTVTKSAVGFTCQSN